MKANPGKLAYGTGNPSGIVAFAQLNALLGLDMLHVPYKSAPLVMPDLLANRVQALMDPPAVALAYVKEGKLRALVTTLNRRSPLLQQSPPETRPCHKRRGPPLRQTPAHSADGRRLMTASIPPRAKCRAWRARQR